MEGAGEKRIQCALGTMRAVRRLSSAACLLTVLVTLVAGKAIDGSISIEKSKKIESDRPDLDPEKLYASSAQLQEGPKIKESSKASLDAGEKSQIENLTGGTNENPKFEIAQSGPKLNFGPVRENSDFKEIGEAEEEEAVTNVVEDRKTSENLEEKEGTKPKSEENEGDPPKEGSEVKKDEVLGSKVTYNGLKVVRVNVHNKEQKKMIKQLESKGEISTWMGNGTAVDVLVRENKVFDFLREKKFSYDVVIDDLQRAIEEENPPPIAEDEWSEFEGRKGHRMTWQMYHRMADIHGYLNYLTATYPEICSQETIGYSVESKPLKVLKISSGRNDSKAVWVDSGIHAREWITPATSTYVISQMLETGDGSHGVDWYFLPLVNPDGYEHSHTRDRLWRKNRSDPYKGPCAGTDLNRNFGYHWGGQGSSHLPCRETYAGTRSFSEPETDAIRKFVTSKSSDLKAYISLHSYGQYILYPWGYDRKVPPDYADLHRVGKAMADAMKMSGGQNYKVGSAAATLYPAAGGSDDWAKGVAKIKYAYTIELRDTGRHGFILPAQYILPTAQEAYEALKIVAKEVNQL